MATKEEVLDDFLKCLRISLNFILLYSKEHKSFLKSIAELKEKTSALFAYLNPIEIVFTPNELSIENVFYSKMNLYKELAVLFHQRKIQSLKLLPGITEEELVILLDKLALSPKEIIGAGGLAFILSNTPGVAHFSATDLDYSQLLRGEGEEVKDIWSFMLHSAVAGNDSRKIDEFADNFEVMIRKFKADNLVENEELKEDLHKFMEYLKKTDQEKFLRCSREIPRLIIKDKSVFTDEQKIKKLKGFISELNTQDYAHILWNEMVNDENFDTASFQLFSKLLGDKDNEKIASNLAENLSGKNSPKIPANVASRIRGMFSSNSAIPQIYRQAILSMGESQTFRGTFVFDRLHLSSNYHFILINLLLVENNGEHLELIAERLYKEWAKIAEENDPDFLKCLAEVIQAKAAGDLSLPAFIQLSRNFYGFIEASLWSPTQLPQIWEIFKQIKTSSLKAEDYLKKIFDDGLFNPRVLSAFFRFFPDSLPDFCGRIKARRADIDFVAKVLESLSKVDSPLVLSALEDIYSFSGDIIRIEIIQIMGQTGRYNREFIDAVLKNGSNFLKKEALLVASGQENNQKALEILFMLPNPWARNNKILLENLGIVEELKYHPAKEYLERLDRRTPFWNIRLKKRIKQVRERFDV
jgi:hypothetical protein